MPTGEIMFRTPKFVIASTASVVTLAGCMTVGSIGAIGSNVNGNANSSAGINADVNANVNASINGTANVNGPVRVDTSATVNQQQTVVNNPQPTSTPTSAATASPTPRATGPDPVWTTMTGNVFDDVQQRLSDVTVTAKVLGGGTFSNGTDTFTTTSQVGKYTLSGAPIGQTILISATKAGFTPREQTVVVTVNGTLDFSGATFALSDKPEVITMTPRADATGVDPSTTFTLTFSEPVNKNDVENGFAIFVAQGVVLSAGVGVLHGSVSQPTYDQGAFTFAWSNNDQTVTATFRPGFKLPTDKNAANIPQYGVGLKGNIRDAAGSGTRSSQFFHVGPAQVGQDNYTFLVAADTTAPRLTGISAVVRGFNQSTDAIRYQFSETMVLFPSNASAYQIPANGSTSALYAGNLKWLVDPTGTAPKPALGDMTGSAASARLYAAATNNDTVEIDAGGTTLQSGQTVWGSVSPSVIDPAGNAIETTNSSNIKSCKAI